MSRRVIAILALLALTACGDGQPFFEEEDDGTGGGDGEGDCVICGDPDLPPGTEEPLASGGIQRFEGREGDPDYTGDNEFGGFVESVSYNATDDTFTVDNLAFDGANVYQRGTAVASLGDPDGAGPLTGYAVYEGDEIARDSLTGAIINQFEYRAIYGVSTNTTTVGGETVPMSQFAIIRTGSYIDYGFGGFLYERNGAVTIPTTGQAQYTGGYAGMRVFTNRGGLEYTRADIRIAIDFRDFNDGPGVRGSLTNRQAFDIDGNPIPLGTGDDDLQLPTVVFVVGPGVMTDSGEISSGVVSSIFNAGSGALETYEEGTYFGILGGPDANEIVGIIAMESEDPRFSGVTAQETGGFIVYR